MTKINSTHKPAGEAGRHQVFFPLKTLTILMSLCIFSFDISGPFFSLIFKKGRKEGRMAVKADVKNEREGDIEKR